MSDNLHRKLYDKLQQSQHDMPDYSPEEWLELDNRLELAEKRKRRRLWLLASLPFLLLLLVNGLLGWKLWNHTHNQNDSLSALNKKVVFDTIYHKVTIYQYDTIYHTIYKSSIRNSLIPSGALGQQLASGDGGSMNDFNATANNSDANNAKGAGAANPEASTQQEARIQYLERLPYLAMSLLRHPGKQWYDLFREIPVRPATPRRVSFLRRGHLSFGLGPVLSWKDDLIGYGGKSVCLGNEIELGTERLSWWQEVSWNELRIKTESVIEGFPNPPSPDPNAKLDKTIFYRRDLGLHTGFGYALPVKKQFEAGLRIGIGANYRLGGLHLLDYEDHDTDTHYELTEKVSSGWDGWNASAGLGFGWQASKSWQVHLQGNYYHYLGAGLADWRIPGWASIRLGIKYRWR